MTTRFALRAIVFTVILLIAGCSSQEAAIPPLNSPPAPLNSPIATPDGSTLLGYSGGSGKVAFAFDLSDVYQVGVLNLATGEITTLTATPPSGSSEPVWAPGGTALYYSSGPNNAFGINRMNSDGSDQQIVVPSPDGVSGNFSPAMSRDGKRLAFHANRDGNMEIYTANADGSDVRNLTNNPASDTTPDWSPDGSKIVFSSDRSGEYQLYTMNSDGSDAQLLFERKEFFNFRPRYSPDGKLILFGTQLSLGGDYHLATVDANGSNFRQITQGSGQFAQGAWIGNDDVVFSGRAGEMDKWQLYRLTLGSRALIRLTFTNANFRNPAWIGQ